MIVQLRRSTLIKTDKQSVLYPWHPFYGRTLTITGGRNWFPRDSQFTVLRERPTLTLGIIFVDLSATAQALEVEGPCSGRKRVLGSVSVSRWIAPWSTV